MPEAAPQNPYIPQGMQPLTFEQFQGIWTAATRPGIRDEQMWWCDGFMPLGPQFLRTLYGVGTALWTAPSTLSIILYKFINIGATPYMIAVLSNGSIYAVNTITSAASQIAPAATITTPAIGLVGINQYGAQYAMIVANQTDGYWLWNGTLLYGPGTLSPVVTVTAPGAGYTTATASVAGGSGGGATFTVQVSGGVVTGVTVTNPGSGWAGGDVVTMTIAGTHTGLATATVQLMPRGIGGTTVETYAGHVWIGKGAVNTWSAPGSAQDFSSANGGGNYTSSDSWLRVKYTQFISTNGFLYLVGDSSISYISGVQTSGVSPVTSFTLQNADPEVGTIWPDTVEVFGRNIVLANSFGAHISYGAAVTKISEALDGVYNTVPIANFGTLTPSAAKANIFGKKVWMFLLPIIDPITQVQTNKLFMWNGKIWWAATQDVPLTYIASQEINSELLAWGTNGSSVYPLFTTPSTAVNKVVQSRLWAVGGIFTQKDSGRLWVLAQYYTVGNPNLVVSIDNEFGVSTQTVTLSPRGVIWHTVSGATAHWTALGGAPVTWFIAGINVYDAQPVGQTGILLGETLQTYCDDMALISVVIDAVVVTYRG
jgi:hypothetical protein